MFDRGEVVRGAIYIVQLAEVLVDSKHSEQKRCTGMWSGGARLVHSGPLVERRCMSVEDMECSGEIERGRPLSLWAVGMLKRR